MPLFAEQDKEILKYAASFVNLRVRDFEELTGRGKRALQHRLRKLLIEYKTRQYDEQNELSNPEIRRGLGYLYSLPNPENPFEKVFFLTQKGWDRALSLGLVKDEVNANREKSDDQLDHDFVLTDFHKALHFAFGDRLVWNQLYKSRYHKWGDKRTDRGDAVDEYVNADAFFYLKTPEGKYESFFVEIENQKGVQEPMRKMRAYTGFANGHFQDKFKVPDFRVIILKPTYDMAVNLLNAARTEKEIATKRFWITDYQAAMRPNERTFYTPRDFTERTWGFQDLMGLV